MRSFLRLAGVSLLCFGLAFLLIWRKHIWWWIEIHTGTVNEPGPYYGFWSGFGSDIGEYSILVAVMHGVVIHYRMSNCKEPKCWRLGHYELTMDGTKYKVCHKHHPGLDGVEPRTGHIRDVWNRHHGVTHV